MSFPDLGLTDYLFGIVRLIAAVGGAVVGWFGSDPLTRLAYRVSFRAPTPGPLVAVMKIGCALTLALLIYFYLPLGGSGGLGFGPGMGGAPSKGNGTGGDKSAASSKNPTADSKPDPAKATQSLQPIEIEIISGKLFKNDGKDRYFIVDHQQPALSHDELDDYLKRSHAKIEVTPVLTNDSIGVGREDSPLSQLLALTKKHAVKTLTPKTP